MQSKEYIALKRTRDTEQNPRAARVFVSPVLILSQSTDRRVDSLQHTRITVAFARWKFLMFLGLKTIKKPSVKGKSLVVGT